MRVDLWGGGGGGAHLRISPLAALPVGVDQCAYLRVRRGVRGGVRRGVTAGARYTAGRMDTGMVTPQPTTHRPIGLRITVLAHSGTCGSHNYPVLC